MEPNGARPRIPWPTEHSGQRVRGVRGGAPFYVRSRARPGGPWCPACERSKRGHGKVCKRRDCPGYVGVWLGDQGIRVLENLISYGGAVCMVTLTPPGAETLPWDREHCRELHADDVKCSGRLGCRVVPSHAREFNEDAMRRWSALWASVRVSCHEKFGPGAVRLLAYVPEPQKRGVIHFHICLGARTPRERAALKYAARLLSRRARAHGWGNVDDRPAYKPLQNGVSAAVYLSKYLTDSRKPGGLRELVVTGQAPRRAVYVSTILTRETRCTMRNLRARRYAFHLTGRRQTCREAERTVKVASLVGLLTTMKGLAERESVRLGHAPPLPPRREAASPAG